MSDLLRSGSTGYGHRQLSGKELEKYNEESKKEWAKLEITFTREVLFEKYEPYLALVKAGILHKKIVRKYIK
jgi:hypothetical protein